jgi:hypothetical protein
MIVTELPAGSAGTSVTIMVFLGCGAEKAASGRAGGSTARSGRP